MNTTNWTDNIPKKLMNRGRLEVDITEDICLFLKGWKISYRELDNLMEKPSGWTRKILNDPGLLTLQEISDIFFFLKKKLTFQYSALED